MTNAPALRGLYHAVAVTCGGDSSAMACGNAAAAENDFVPRSCDVDVGNMVAQRVIGRLVHVLADRVESLQQRHAQIGCVEHGVGSEHPGQTFPIAEIDEVAITSRNFVQFQTILDTKIGHGPYLNLPSLRSVILCTQKQPLSSRAGVPPPPL